MTSVTYELHEHCENCIKITRCSISTDAGRSCPIIFCPLDCRARFHACKKNEHDLLCPNIQTQCYNAEYGCPELMKRCHLAKHLSKCPASVIHCPIEWIRNTVSPHSEFLHVEENNEVLDVSLLLRDQRQLNRNLTHIKNGGCLISKFFPKKTSVYPYSNPQLSGDDDLNWSCTTEIENENLKCSSDVLDQLRVLSDQPTTVVLDMNISCVKEAKYFSPTRSFSCSQVLRRDEFPWHYQNAHSDILGAVGGWLEERCPLSEYGCPFSLRRLYPLPKGSTVIYDRERECPGLKLMPHSSQDFCSLNDGQGNLQDTQKAHIAISELPYEILHKIGTYLDGFSLHNMSQTCHLMKDVCNTLLKEKGLVLISWTKKKINGRVSWQKGNTYWRFSTSFTPIKGWYFGNEKHMSNHLRDCPFMERNTHAYGAPQLADLLARGTGDDMSNLVLRPVKKPFDRNTISCSQM